MAKFAETFCLGKGRGWKRNAGKLPDYSPINRTGATEKKVLLAMKIFKLGSMGWRTAL